MKSAHKVLISHLCYWVIIVCLDVWRNYGGDLEYWVVGYVFYVFPFYLIYFILIPEIALKPTALRLGILFCTSLTLFYVSNEIKHYVFHLMNPLYHFNEYRFNRVEGVVISQFMIISCCYGLRLFRDWITNNDENARLSMEKAQGELKSYKNKMDLSTMKVTLSKMKEMALNDPESIQTSILELSNLLRFNLYESNRGSVTIEQEITAIQNQLSLHEQVTGHIVAFNFDSTLNQEHISPGVILKSVSEFLKVSPKGERLEITKTDKTLQLSFYDKEEKLIILKQNLKLNIPQLTFLECVKGSLQLQLNMISSS